MTTLRISLDLQSQTDGERLDQHLIDLRTLRTALEDTKRQCFPTLGVFTDARLEDVITKLDEAEAMLTCDLCPHAAVTERGIGNVCPRCDADYIVCPGCGCDVRVTDAIDTDGKLWHGPCAPQDSQRVRDWVSGE